MTEITVISVGTLKEQYLTAAVEEYKKRLSQFARVFEVNIKEEKIADEDNRTEIANALDKEGEKILQAVPKSSRLITLCIEGKEYDSEGLSALIENFSDECGRIALVIGSSHGLSPKVKAASDVKLSFSRLTFPHQLMRVILFEALYRSFTIIAGKRYHK